MSYQEQTIQGAENLARTLAVINEFEAAGRVLRASHMLKRGSDDLPTIRLHLRAGLEVLKGDESARLIRDLLAALHA